MEKKLGNKASHKKRYYLNQTGRQQHIAVEDFCESGTSYAKKNK